MLFRSEGFLKYVASIVLGVSDALVELTGAMSGIAFALQANRLVALTGLVTGVAAAAKDAGVQMCHNRVGSMFTWFFAAGPVTDWTSAAKSDTEAFGRFFRSMLESGIYLPPSQFEAAFLGAAHTEHDVQQTIAAAKQAFAAVHA